MQTSNEKVALGGEMLCQICGKREATFHLQEVVNGKARELHICEVCAKEKGLSESFLIPTFSLSNLIAGLTEWQIPPSEKTMITCPHCGLTYSDIQKKGKIGCSSCYRTFKSYLNTLLERIQGRTLHSGKIPRRSKAKDTKEKRIYELRRYLEEAVRKEEYEKAAQLRDEIRRLEKNKD